MDYTEVQIDFARGLYLEHLEEASFLYEQRLSLLDDPELTWLDIEDFEDRFEPHIDGLVVGEELALEVCQQQATEGDFGELHAAVRVFCRQNRLDLVQKILEELEIDDEERIQAISDALNFELPESWQKTFIELLNGEQQKLNPILTKLFGYKRIPAGEGMLKLLQQENSDGILNAVWSMGRIREQSARAPLFNICLYHRDDEIRAEAALALLRLGEPQVITLCLQHASSESWSFLALGLGGSLQVVPTVRQIAATERVTQDCLLALGLLGDISGMNILLQQLSNQDLAEAAAMALYLITGAELFEENFIPEDIDEDELFEEELEKLRKGESLYPSGESPPGITITRISQKIEDWQKWWTENASRFDPSIRYRNGKPYSPACLLENLQSDKSPRKVRQLAYEELVIRYGIDFPFETDMFVAQQKQAITQYSEWIKVNEINFKPGRWYFAGQLMA